MFIFKYTLGYCTIEQGATRWRVGIALPSVAGTPVGKLLNSPNTEAEEPVVDVRRIDTF